MDSELRKMPIMIRSTILSSPPQETTPQTLQTTLQTTPPEETSGELISSSNAERKPILSDEQRLFVEHPILQNSKLFAPPGSGKSTCIIQRQIFLVQSGTILKHQSLILSFSRNSRQDIENRVLQFPNFSHFFQQSPSSSQTIENIKTLDALSFQIQSQLKQTPNYEDLSYDLSRSLDQLFQQFSSSKNQVQFSQSSPLVCANDGDDLQSQELVNTWLRLPVLCDLKAIFVDEAQDLDCYQFNIIIKLQQLLGLFVTLVGDPNQSIYNFKKSSPRFMIQYPAKEFYLTKNFRSSSAIVVFSEHLKPHPTPGGKETKSFAQHSVNTKPHIFHTPFKEFWMWLAQFLQTFKGDLSEIAILCPTKGHSSAPRGSLKFITKQSKLHGLARVTNLLDQCGIPFTQCYNESSDSDNQSKFETRTGHVNVLTFHGSKGKEWNTVICCDVWHELLNTQPNRSELDDQKYLLFVAMTRARHHLFVHIEKIDDNEGGSVRHRLPNQFLTLVPQHLYTGNITLVPKTFPIRETKHQISSITEIAKKMPHDLRSELREIVKWEIIEKKQVYQDYREICESVIRHDNILFGEFLENLFAMQCAYYQHRTPREISIVHAFLSGKKVFLSNAEFSLIYPVWTSNSDWQTFDRHQKSLSAQQRDVISKHFTRSVDWKNHFLTCDDSYELLWNQYSRVRECYTILMDTTLHWKEKVDSLFFLTVVQYTYANNHLFHIRNGAEVKKHLISQDLHPLFESMSQFAATFSSETSFSEQVPVRLPFLSIDGVMDIQFNNSTAYTGDNRIMETKACKDLCAFPHICQVFLYLLCDMADFNDLNSRPIILFNFLSGEFVTLRFTIQESSMMRLFTILSVSSSTLLDSLTLRIQVSADNINNSEVEFETAMSGGETQRQNVPGNQKLSITVRNEEYSFNWLEIVNTIPSSSEITRFQEFLNCMNGKCRIICQGRLTEQKTLLEDIGVSFRNGIKGNQLTSVSSGDGGGAQVVSSEKENNDEKNVTNQYGKSCEIPWIDAAWLEDTFWPVDPAETSWKSKPSKLTKTEKNKRQRPTSGRNYFQI